MMTYKELAALIAAMPENRQNDNVTVFDSEGGEAFAAQAFGAVEMVDQQGDIEGILDEGHFVLKI